MRTNIEIFHSYPIIVTIANDKYSLALAVMLKSLVNNLKDGVQVKVFVLNHGMSAEGKMLVESSIKDRNLLLTWVEINPVRLQDLKVSGHISIDTYYRLLIEELFPMYEKIIYLDADIVINKSIDELWDFEFEDKLLLAIPHASKISGFVSGERGLPAYKLLGIPKNTRTFNAGVMVLNLKLWRKQSVSRQIIDYLRNYKNYVLWWDQDGLNAILYNNWLPLPAVWNVMTNHLVSFSSWNDSLLSIDEFHEVQNSPAIIHYAGPLKPWLPNYDGPFLDIFLNYSNQVIS